MIDAKTLGARIRERRMAKGWTQYDLAGRVGCHRAHKGNKSHTVSGWETGRFRPAARFEVALMRELRDDLFDDEERVADVSGLTAYRDELAAGGHFGEAYIVTRCIEIVQGRA